MATEDVLVDRFRQDFTSFLNNLASHLDDQQRQPKVILDFGNENLVWARGFPGETIPDGQFFL